MATDALQSPDSRPGRLALIVAHPGHELRVFHWMELHRPLYFCLTDGSGGIGASRLDSTTRLLEKTGTTPGTIFGRHTDRELYRLLLEGRVGVFAALSRELAQALIACDATSVAGDAAEGFNPVHDVCRFILDGAVEMVRRQTGRTLRNNDFVLDSAPDNCPELLRKEALWLQLDSAAVDRKVAAALDYSELRDEVNAALARFGKEAFALECLRPASAQRMIEGFETELPAYERFGEMRRSEGRYSEIIRYRQHVLPVREAIEKAAREPSPFLN
jgi:hypothetical protein